MKVYGAGAMPVKGRKHFSWLNFGEETILSTIKIRQAGFADCIDTHESFRRQLGRLCEMKIIP